MDPLAVLFERFAARGDVAALGEVFDRTAKHLLHLAMHLARSAEDAEDLLQATFVLAMKKAGTFAMGEPLLPWLSGILAGEARNLARRNQHRRAEPLPDLADTEGGPIASAERSELVARLRARVEDLPPEQRTAMLLQLQHGLSPTDIAEVLDVPPGTVRMRLHRGMQALRRLLPSALAVWLFGALPTRGLAAVRSEVLREAGAVAKAASVPATAAVAAGVLSMKCVFGAAALLLAAVLCWWFISSPLDPTPVAGGANGPAPVATSVAAAATGEAPAAERLAVADAIDARDDTGSLRVHVASTSSGRPIVGLTLRLWPGSDEVCVDGTAQVARTDAGGGARFAALAPGEWRVETLGFQVPATGVQVAAGAETSHAITLVARPVHGIVVDASGAPVAGASIRVGESNAMTNFLFDSFRPDVSLEAFVRTAAISAGDGTFACDAGEGEPNVAASHPAYRSSPTQLTRAVGLARWRCVLEPRTREVRGVVLDGERKPIASASVVARVFERAVRTADGTWCGPNLLEFATTGADGRFVFGMLPPGNTQLEAIAPGWRRATVGTAKPNDDLEIVLGDGTEIVGTIRVADGTPFGSGYVSLRVGSNRVLAGDEGQAFVRSGRFVIREAPRPPFTIAVYGDGTRSPLLEQQVAHCDGASARVELVVPARQVLRGVVVDEGNRPLANWIVAAYLPETARGEPIAGCTADAEGRFTLRHLHNERLRVVATWPDGDPADPATAQNDVSPSGELVLRVPAERLPRGSVAGRVVDGAGMPIAGASLCVSPRNEPRIRYLAASRSDGAFRIERVPAGGYLLSLTAGDEPPRTLRSVNVPRDEPVDLGDVGVLPLATLRVEVVRADDTPWREALPDVYLTEPDGTPRPWLPEFRDGGFEGRLEPGPVRARVTGPDLIAPAQDVALLPGERRVVRMALMIGRSIGLVFAGDETEKEKDPWKDRLHVEVVDEKGAVVLREKVRRDRPNYPNWTLEHTFPFGEYTVTARTDSDRRYRGTFVAADAMPTRSIDVPRQP